MYSRGKSSFSSYSSYTGSGKVPKYALLASRLGPALTEMTMLNHWLKNKPGSTDIYAANPYETQALSTMASNRVTPYPALQAINLENRKGIYNINQSGGYSSGQRQNARVAQNIGAQRNVANALLQAQEQNAKYRDQWAQAALSAGAQDAQRRQAANQYNWEAYNKAHGAKTKGIETHLANLGAMWQKYWADRIKNKQYEDILNIYQQDVDNKKDALNTIYGIGRNANNADGSTANNKPASLAASIKYNNIPTSMYGINYNTDPFFNKVMQWRLATPSNNAGYIDPFAMVDYVENIKR